MTTDAQRVAAARRWFRTLGLAPIRDGDAVILADPAHPDTFELNLAMVTPGADAGAALAVLDRHFAHTAWRAVFVDALDPPAVEATLALAGFSAPGTVIEMLARTVASSRPLPGITTVLVTEANWADFVALVEVDHAEGQRTGSTSPAVGAGLLAAQRARLPHCDYRLIVADGVAAGYGMTVACPGGLGLIEHLFTLPDRRGRGLMSAFIVDATARLRTEGCDAVFLDAHAGQAPAQLYASLGFAPVALWRTWSRRLP